ncbi:hypothetical protein [Hydrogenispora ethanolica]|uniref:hypothetical protein n=1 Tax=Hydrogenispora ethanolica TaxID=1082276 RepID=UPI001405506D|nr:hypothetical protein [Hydrogenispora ethanolica]
MLILYGQKEFAEAIGWDDRKLRVYYQRGKLPEPFAMVGDRPAWTKEQVEEFKKILTGQ